MKNFELTVFRSPDELAQAVARAWLDEITAANLSGRSLFMALSGGRITQKILVATVEQAVTARVSFNQVHFFWADERCVPPADTESNFRAAEEFLLKPLKVPLDHIHRIRGEEVPDAAARAAEDEIRRIVPPDAAGQPALDLVFLGLGEDGHVASLFPGEPEEVSASKAGYRAVNNSPKPPPQRITLGYSTLAAAKKVWMIASGAGKEKALLESLSPQGKTPFARVLNLRRHTEIFTDIEMAM